MTCEEVKCTNHHVKDAEIPPHAEPSDKSATLADTLIAAWWVTLKHNIQLSLTHRNSDNKCLLF